jgi:prepilin-type N-terminal cleavage/methylation domain-containing protein
MQKSKLIKTRKGFTLVEVALAVAVGLIIIGGAVLGYNAVKDNASNSNARNRVLSAVTMIEEYSAANAGQYPASVAAGTGPFSTMWQAKRPDDKALSPWGGATGNTTSGVSESAPVAFEATAPAAATASVAGAFTAGATLAANMLYVTPSTADKFAAITATSTSSLSQVKNYAIGIADKAGTPWWDAKGGK